MSYAIVQGCSKGFGREVVRALLASTQLHVIGTTSSGAGLAKESILDGKSKEDASRLTTLDMDVCDEKAIERASHEVKERFGNQLRLLVNVSGVLHAEKNLASVSYEDLLKTFRVNTFGHLMVYKHFVPLIPRNADMHNAQSQSQSQGYGEENLDLAQGAIPSGRTILTSVTARVGSIGDNHKGGWYSYRSSKAATNQIIRVLSHELRLRNIPGMCFAYHPGTMKTDLAAPYVSQKQANESEGLFEPDQAARKFMAVLKGLEDEQNGTFIDWAGKCVQW